MKDLPSGMSSSNQFKVRRFMRMMMILRFSRLMFPQNLPPKGPSGFQSGQHQPLVDRFAHISWCFTPILDYFMTGLWGPHSPSLDYFIGGTDTERTLTISLVAWFEFWVSKEFIILFYFFYFIVFLGRSLGYSECNNVPFTSIVDQTRLILSYYVYLER